MGIIATTTMGYMASRRSKSKEEHAGGHAMLKGEVGTESLAAVILAAAAETKDENQEVLRDLSDASAAKEAPEVLGMTEVLLASTVLLGVIAVSNVGVPSIHAPTIKSRDHVRRQRPSSACQELMTIKSQVRTFQLLRGGGGRRSAEAWDRGFTNWMKARKINLDEEPRMSEEQQTREFKEKVCVRFGRVLKFTFPYNAVFRLISPIVRWTSTGTTSEKN